MAPEIDLGCPGFQVSTEKVADLPEIFGLYPMTVKINEMELIVYEYSSGGDLRPYGTNFFRISTNNKGESGFIFPSSLETPGKNLRPGRFHEGYKITFFPNKRFPNQTSIHINLEKNNPGFASVSTLVDQGIVEVGPGSKLTFEELVLVPAPRGTDRKASPSVVIIEAAKFDEGLVKDFLFGRGLWQARNRP